MAKKQVVAVVKIQIAAGKATPAPPPQVLHDYAMSVIQQAVMTQAQYDDRVMLCKTRFECQGQDAQWNLICVPSPELLRLIEEKLHST
jgi:hypothetical protein